jgi:hypothetical protein
MSPPPSADTIGSLVIHEYDGVVPAAGDRLTVNCGGKHQHFEFTGTFESVDERPDTPLPVCRWSYVTASAE